MTRVVQLPEDSWLRQGFLVCVPRLPEPNELRARLKLQTGSYADELVQDLLQLAKLRTVHLDAEYRTYFNVEYATFEEYVTRRFGWPKDILEVATEYYSAGAQVIKLRAPYSFLGDEDLGVPFLEVVFGNREAL